MFARNTLRISRSARPCRNTILRNARHESQASGASNALPSSPGAGGALAGGLAGGAAALITVYAWYSFSGTKSAVQAAKQTKAYVDQATESLKVKFDEKTPDNVDDAIKTLRDVSFAAM